MLSEVSQLLLCKGPVLGTWLCVAYYGQVQYKQCFRYSSHTLLELSTGSLYCYCVQSEDFSSNCEYLWLNEAIYNISHVGGETSFSAFSVVNISEMNGMIYS